MSQPAKDSGSELLREIRDNDELRDLPVVVLTASSNPEDRELALELGANHYFTKAVDFDAFTETVRELYALAWSGRAHAQKAQA